MNQQAMNHFFLLLFFIAKIFISFCVFSLAFLSFPPSSLGLVKCIPMMRSAASNALTSASDLSATLVIRQDFYLSGSPTATVLFLSIPSYLYHILFLLSLSIISFHSEAARLQSVLSASSLALLILLSIITRASNFSRWLSLLENCPT